MLAPRISTRVGRQRTSASVIAPTVAAALSAASGLRGRW